MESKLAREVRARMQAMESAQLEAILESTDLSDYTPASLEIARQVLADRRAGLPTTVRPVDSESFVGPASLGDDSTLGPQVMKVIVTDVTMPFGSMIAFMIKWAIAAIPAIIILSSVAALVFGIMSALLAVLKS